jgi:hypothetical protein
VPLKGPASARAHYSCQEDDRADSRVYTAL